MGQLSTNYLMNWMSTIVGNRTAFYYEKNPYRIVGYQMHRHENRMKFKTVWLWPLIDTLNSSIDWDNLGERLYVTTTAHYVLFKDT